jgi:hypothetical protein
MVLLRSGLLFDAEGKLVNQLPAVTVFQTANATLG